MNIGNYTSNGISGCSCSGFRPVHGFGALGEEAPAPPPVVMGAALGIVPTLGLGLAIWAALNWDKWNRRGHA